MNAFRFILSLFSTIFVVGLIIAVLVLIGFGLYILYRNYIKG